MHCFKDYQPDYDTDWPFHVIKPSPLSSSAGPLRAKAGHNTRQEILDAAAIVFSEMGYKAASMQAIAERVGIRPPSIYSHFQSKKQILYTVVEEATTNLLSTCEKSVKQSPPSPGEQLIAFVKAHVYVELDRLEVMSVMDNNLFRGASINHALDKRQEKILVNIQRNIMELLRRILEDGQKAGVMDFKDLDVTTFAILGIIEHIPYWYRPDGRLSADELVQEVAELTLITAGFKSV